MDLALARATFHDRRRTTEGIADLLELAGLRTEEELLDAGEDVQHLLDDCDALDLSPAVRLLLLDLDDALTMMVARAHARGRSFPPTRRPRRLGRRARR